MIQLRCVECGGVGLSEQAAETLACQHCGATFPRHRFKAIPVLVGKRSSLDVAAILAHSGQDATLIKGHAAGHWATTGKLSEILSGCAGKELLNYGAGEGSDRRLLESRGYRVTTFDIFPSEHTDFICDGHELPFADEQFDVVTSIAVLEHLRDPFQAMSEVCRVLKKGGSVVGSNAFLEPYHAQSYFHISHLGLQEIFRRAGFSDVRIYPGWSYLEALNGSFWIWNKIGPVKWLMRRLDRLKYRTGMGLWRLGYRLRGTPPPAELPYRFCGSLVFQAIK